MLLLNVKCTFVNNKLVNKINIFSTNGNLIRFLLAIGVILHHSSYLSQNNDGFLYVLTNGQITFGGISVLGFFFFSGLYVTKSMHKAQSCSSFLWARCKRIFPALFFVVFLCVFLLGPVLTSYDLGDYFKSSSTYLYLLNAILIPVHNLPGVFEQNIYGPTVNGSL